MGRGHIAHDFATFHLDSGMAEFILNCGEGGGLQASTTGANL